MENVQASRERAISTARPQGPAPAGGGARGVAETQREQAGRQTSCSSCVPLA
jgi:hypothetical protein